MINIDFVTGLSRSQNPWDSIWVIVDWMTKFSLFLLMRNNYLGEDYAKLFIQKIVKFNGEPMSIILE